MPTRTRASRSLASQTAGLTPGLADDAATIFSRQELRLCWVLSTLDEPLRRPYATRRIQYDVEWATETTRIVTKMVRRHGDASAAGTTYAESVHRASLH